jgi:hypothetical protein
MASVRRNKAGTTGLMHPSNHTSKQQTLKTQKWFQAMQSSWMLYEAG